MSSVSAIQKKSLHEQILDLPDTYIGSTDAVQENTWVFDESSGKMAYRSVIFNPGFYKIFDEIIVNARDAVVRAASAGASVTPVKHIGVEVVDTEQGQMIIIENDGDGLDVAEHPVY